MALWLIILFLLTMTSLGYPPLLFVSIPLIAFTALRMRRDLRELRNLQHIEAAEKTEKRRFKSAQAIKGMFPL